LQYCDRTSKFKVKEVEKLESWKPRKKMDGKKREPAGTLYIPTAPLTPQHEKKTIQRIKNSATLPNERILPLFHMVIIPQKSWERQLVIHMDTVYTSGMQETACTRTDWMPSGELYTYGWWLAEVD
jgi:hypothetical protein